MPNTKRKVKFCKKLAADKKIKTSNQKIKNNVANIEIFNDNNDMETEENLEELLSNEAEEELTNNEIEIDENFEWFDNEIEENAEHIYNVLSNNIENALSSSNRPLVYLGNSRTTKYRKKIEAEKDAEKNAQTLDNFFSNNTIDNKIKQKDNCLNLAIDRIEFKLNTENLTPGYKVRLKAVQKYLILRNKKYEKNGASEIVSDLMNKGKWFSRCIRSWSKTFLEYGDVPKCRCGQHLIGSSILNDEDVKSKISSYLRINKFDITSPKFCDYVSNEILPKIGIENKTNIR
jgi:hypothetical protein